MCGLQFFGQIAIWSIRVHERIVRKRSTEAKTDDEAVQLRDRIQLALRVKDLFKRAALFFWQGVFYLRQVIRDEGSQFIRAAARSYRSRMGINIAKKRFSRNFICRHPLSVSSPAVLLSASCEIQCNAD